MYIRKLLEVFSQIKQGWEFALSLYALSLKIAHLKIELPWVIRCCCSLKKRNFERIPLIALYKRAAMSKSLLSLFKKDQCQWFTREPLFHSKKNERFARKKSYFSPCFLQFFTVFPLSMLKSDSLPSLFIPLLFFKELLWANRSCLSLQKEWLWVIRSHCSLQKSHGSDALISKRESLFRSVAHKKDSDLLNKPKSKFPTLKLCTYQLTVLWNLQ